MIIVLFSLFAGFLLTGGMNIPIIDRLKVSGSFIVIFLAIVVIFADKRDETVINTVKQEVISIFSQSESLEWSKCVVENMWEKHLKTQSG